MPLLRQRLEKMTNNDGFIDLYVGGYETWPGATHADFVLTNRGGKAFELTWSEVRYRARGISACDFDRDGIVLASGRRVDADVVVTATGLQLQALGGVAVSVDGEKVAPNERFIYRRHMLEDVPNAAWSLGYTNASWTLGADLTARSVANLLAYMRSRGYTYAYPHLGDAHMPEQPAFNLQAGYVLRGADDGFCHVEEERDRERSRNHNGY